MFLNRKNILLTVITLLVCFATAGCGETADPVVATPLSDAVEMTTTDSAPAPDAPPAAPEPPDPADAVLGHWYSDGDDSQILITKENGKIGGKIIWLASPNYDEEGDEDFGKPKQDKNNPDESLQDRPIIGLGMIDGFSYDADDSNWSGGSIYDPESGKTYKCQIKLGDGDTLDVRGYIGIPALGRTTVWRRVPAGEEKSEEAVLPSA